MEFQDEELKKDTDANPNFDSDLATYFASFLMERFGIKDREGMLRVDRIEEAILARGEESDIFQLISGFSTANDNKLSRYTITK